MKFKGKNVSFFLLGMFDLVFLCFLKSKVIRVSMSKGSETTIAFLLYEVLPQVLQFQPSQLIQRTCLWGTLSRELGRQSSS